MANVTVHEAKTHLSRLLRRVAAGEEIVILRGSTPVARLVPAVEPMKREFGYDAGVFEVPEDFDEPLTEEQLLEFES